MTIAIVGKYPPEHVERIQAALARAEEDDAIFFTDLGSAQLGLSEGAVGPSCVFAPGLDPQLEGFIAWMRGTLHLFSVPLFALVPNPSEPAFAGAHAVGADDVLLDTDFGGFTRRTATVRTFDPHVRPPIAQGRAVVAHPGLKRRRLMGRILRQAGFDVSFASTSSELLEAGSRPSAADLVVISVDLPADGAAPTLRALRDASARPQLPAVVVASPPQLREASQVAHEVGAAVVVSEAAPPDDLLFVANEVLRPGVSNLRGSPRVSFGTLCSFRTAGQLLGVYGFTYNISQQGMYVKTYDPPKVGTPLWLELRPPDDVQAVHLRGHVVWSRSPSHTRAAIVPPGFGLRIEESESPPGDRDRYREGYERLCKERRLLQRDAA